MSPEEYMMKATAFSTGYKPLNWIKVNYFDLLRLCPPPQYVIRYPPSPPPVRYPLSPPAPPPQYVMPPPPKLHVSLRRKPLAKNVARASVECK